MAPAVRRSGRASVKPDNVYEDALREAAEKVTKQRKTTRPQVDEDNDYSEKEGREEEAQSDDEEEEEDEDEGPSRKRKRKLMSTKKVSPREGATTKSKNKAKTPAPRAQKDKKKPIDPYSSDEETSDEEGLDRLLTEGAAARGKGKGKAGGASKRAAATRGRGMGNLKEGKHSLLFESLVRNLPVEKRMREWVRAYEMEEEDDDEMGGTSLVDIFNFLVWSAGAKKSYVNREAEVLPELDSEEWEALVDGMVQDLREGGMAAYPLLEGAKFKGFRGRFAEAWEQLVKASRDGNGHKIEAVRSVIDLVRALCEVPLVSVRHTAAYAGLRLGNALVQETLALSKKVEVASRQLEAEQRKGAGRSRKALDLNKAIEEQTGHQGALEAVLEEIFNGVFASRYRDVNEKVRADCMEGLGFFLETYPSMFLRDQFVKYLGWMLYDKAGAVRAAAAGVLLRLYSKKAYLAQLENFTSRFLKRLEDLVHDVDEGVKRTAVQVLRLLQGAGYLDEASHELLDEVDELLLDPHWDVRTREQAMLFFTDHVDGFNDLSGVEEDEEGNNEQEEGWEDDTDVAEEEGKRKDKTAVASKKKRHQRRSTSGKGGARRRGVMKRLVTVVQFLDYHLGEGEQWVPEHEQLVAACVEAFERHPEGDFLYDWPTYFQLLRESQRAAASSSPAVAGLSDHEQSLLIRLLGASVKRAASHAELTFTSGCNSIATTGAGKKAGIETAGSGPAEMRAFRERKQKLEAALEAFTSGAVEDLPQVLSQFQTDARKMAGLVGLPQYFQAATIANKRNKGHFEALLKLLRDVYLKATDAAVLQDVARSFAHLLQRDQEAGGRLHNVGAILQIIVAELCRRLEALNIDGSCSGSSNKENKCGRGDVSSSGKKDADFSASLVLLQLGTLGKQIDLADYIGGDGEGGKLGALAARVQEVVMFRLQEEQTWGGGEERLQLTVRVVREGTYLLYILLLHSTLGLIRLAQEQKPLTKRMDKKKAVATKGGRNRKAGEDTDGEEDDDDADVQDKDVDEEDEDDDVGKEEANAVVAQRTILLEVLSAVLRLDGSSIVPDGEEEDEEEDGSEMDNEEANGRRSSQGKKKERKAGKGKVSATVVAAMEELKKTAYAVVSDLRFLFRPLCARYQVLHRIVWTPEPDFLRLLQFFFQKEEARFEEAAVLEAEGGGEGDAAAADEVLRRDLLDPLIRSVLYTTESINRRQAAAIAAHFVDSGRQSTESVRFFMKQLKDLDMKLYLEVQMTTLRSCYHKWCQTGSEVEDEEAEAAAAAAGLEKITRLGVRMAQTMGVGRLKAETPAADSFVRFLKSGVAFALEDAPKNFTFLDALRCYMPKLPENRMHEVAHLFREKTAALPQVVKEQVEHERQLVAAEAEDADHTDEGIAYLNFYYELYGHFGVAVAGMGAGAALKRASTTPSKLKRGVASPRITGSTVQKRRGLAGSSSRKEGETGGKMVSSFSSGDRRHRHGTSAAAEESELGNDTGDDEEDSIHSSGDEKGRDSFLSGEKEVSSILLTGHVLGQARGGSKGSSAGSSVSGRRSSAILASVHETEEDIEDEEDEDEDEDVDEDVDFRGSLSQRSQRRSGSKSQRSTVSRKKRERASSQAEEAEMEGRSATGGFESDSETSIFGELVLSKAVRGCAGGNMGKGSKRSRK
ncbi:hypothetical protein VYU27_002672 [Nannochloropsis oceanica]